MADETQLLTVRDVARRCRRSEETVRRWIWSGKLPAKKLGNQLFVDPAAAERIAAEQKDARAAEDDARDPIRELFRKYGYDPVVEGLRESRGQILPSRDQILSYIEEDEALQDEMLQKYGPVDAAGLVREVRE